MQKVITINLNGNAYQLDEDAYFALRAYLDNAEVQLAVNPDKTEIVADLEQAIAEKCAKFLSTHKTVVSASDVTQVLKEMGPVESADEGVPGRTATAERRTGTEPTRRLYQIREGAMISGVCNGIGAYLNIDPTIVRIVFVLLTLITKGAFGLVYFALMIVIPHAHTAEERAAAQGMPFTAQEMINKHWKETRSHWRRQQRAWKQQLRAGVGTPWMPVSPVVMLHDRPSYKTQIVRGILVPLLSVAHAAITIVFFLAFLAVVRSSDAWSGFLPGAPRWVGIVILFVVYQALATPFRFAMYGWTGSGEYGRPTMDAVGGVMWLAMTVLLFWLAYQYVPGVRDFIQQFSWRGDVWRV